ncbi:MAG: response regulator [Ignavibacteriales bacterium]|jgi:DNA-binding NarL/FixJ family response regulator|nr:MAG: response regulator [Ignavibacteriales bacterium]
MTILIADRSLEIRERIKELANDIYKYPKIFETDSYQKAMSIIKSHKPNLIITDIDLENGSGISLLRFIRNQTSRSLIIVFTNQLKYNLEEISRKLGADYFLFKAHDIVKIKKILINSSFRLNHNNYLSN